jgi:hypothetical protein
MLKRNLRHPELSVKCTVGKMKKYRVQEKMLGQDLGSIKVIIEEGYL